MSERPAQDHGVDPELLSPTFLDEVRGKSVDDIRPRLRSCEAAEGRLGYRRRLIHGQLDILRAEIARRSSSDARALLDQLAEILSDPSPSRRGAHVPLPSDLGAEAPEDVVPLARIGEMSDDDLAVTVEGLVDRERTISADRRRLLVVIDALQSELVRAYRESAST